MSRDLDFLKSTVFATNAATLVRFIVQSQYHQPNLSTFEIFQIETLLYGNDNLSVAEIPAKLAINRNSFRFILYLHIYSSS